MDTTAMRLTRYTRGGRAVATTRRGGGFTLVELLVVMGVIALLAATLLPSLAGARKMAQRSACAANLHALGRAFSTYAAEWDNLLPSGSRGTRAGTDAPNTLVLRSGSGATTNDTRLMMTLARYADPRSKLWVCPATGSSAMGTMAVAGGTDVWGALWSTTVIKGTGKPGGGITIKPIDQNGATPTDLAVYSGYVFWVGDRGNLEHDGAGQATAPVYYRADKVTPFDEFGTPAELGNEAQSIKAGQLRQDHLLAQDRLYTEAPLGYGNHPTRGGTLDPQRVSTTAALPQSATCYPADFVTTSVGDELQGFDGANALRADYRAEWVPMSRTVKVWRASGNGQMWYAAWDRP